MGEIGRELPVDSPLAAPNGQRAHSDAGVFQNHYTALIQRGHDIGQIGEQEFHLHFEAR